MMSLRSATFSGMSVNWKLNASAERSRSASAGAFKQARLEALADEIRRAGELRRERQAALEAEINALYPIPKRIKKVSLLQ